MGLKHILASNLRRYRHDVGLTQEALAERAGLHRTYIGGIEQGRVNPSVKIIEKVATALGIEPSLLLLDNTPLAAHSGSVKEEIQYAICSWENGEMTAYPIEVRHEDLTIQVVCALVKLGYTGEELAREYERVINELHGLLSASKPNALLHV